MKERASSNEIVRRKSLGQYFSGSRLSALLASCAWDDQMSSCVDPMAGSGDILAAIAERLGSSRQHQVRIDGVDVDASVAAVCRNRLKDRPVSGRSLVLAGSAFDPDISSQLLKGGYDLVATNPPYVRYQAAAGAPENAPELVRRGLLQTALVRCRPSERAAWLAVISGISGLADISIPSWLLSCMLTKPGGTLALIVPSSWRSRLYADVVRYVMLRFFRIELVVRDLDGGWFDSALVRTELIIARRRQVEEGSQPLINRTLWSSFKEISIGAGAATSSSLVGRLSRAGDPDSEFASRVHTRVSSEAAPVSDCLEAELWSALAQECDGRKWFLEAEKVGARRQRAPALGPGVKRSAQPNTSDPELAPLSELGVQVGQGLRTGANSFFYVTVLAELGEQSLVRASPLLSSVELLVPSSFLQEVVHRQKGATTHGRMGLYTALLNLEGYALAEDIAAARIGVGHQPHVTGTAYRTLPDELAHLVRSAACSTMALGGTAIPLPLLSAVKTNVRGGSRESLPRFWYHIPTIKDRHRPMVYIPRVNSASPQVAINDGRKLIDANFTTVWDGSGGWNSASLYAVFSSTLVRRAMLKACVEMGGGALKLEADRIKRIRVPIRIRDHRESLGRIGQQLLAGDVDAQRSLDSIFS